MHQYLLVLSFFLVPGLSVMAQTTNWGDIQKDVQSQLILAEDGDVITLPAGHFRFTRSLSMDRKSNITIRGAGMGETILSFAGQKEGAEGLKITHGSNIRLEGFTVLDAKGDAIKVQYVDGITFLDVKTAWSGRPKRSNGAYGFYPVLCTQVRIEYCEAQGASDAGIYVGQSSAITVAHNKAYENVAGIEIENSSEAEVFENEAFHNTGGILVFDLPNLTRYGYTCRVYNNRVYDNNLRNFAPKGNVVGSVPAGSGIILLATTQCEVFENVISGHRTSPIAMASYYLIDENIDDVREPEYDPYITGVSIHHNRFEGRQGHRPAIGNQLGLLLFMKFGWKVPEILFDGLVDADRVGDNQQYEAPICVYGNSHARFGNLNLASGVNAKPIFELGPYGCENMTVSSAHD